MLSSEKKLEKDRYHPISKALNAILREFRGKAYGDIPVPELRENEEVVYMPNDPATIESSHLKGERIARADRKPDVIGVFVPFFREMFKGNNVADFDFKDVVTEIGKTHFSKTKRNFSCKPTWKDVQQTWELKNAGKEMKFPVENATWNTEDILNRSLDQPEEEEPKPQEKPTKRGREGDDDTQKPPKKRSCGGSSYTSSIFNEGEGSTSKFNLSGPPGNDTSLSHDVQCAFYAIERLRAAWFITHSTVMLLTGD